MGPKKRLGILSNIHTDSRVSREIVVFVFGILALFTSLCCFISFCCGYGSGWGYTALGLFIGALVIVFLGIVWVTELPASRPPDEPEA